MKKINYSKEIKKHSVNIEKIMNRLERLETLKKKNIYELDEPSRQTNFILCGGILISLIEVIFLKNINTAIISILFPLIFAILGAIRIKK